MIRLYKIWSSRFKKKGDFFFEIEKITGVRPRQLHYYQLALRHSSASDKSRGKKLNNQRLEYLGDAVLGAVVADYLYEKYPSRGEGFLTSMRSKIVSRKTLNWLAHQIGLPPLLVKKTHRTAQAKSIYGDAIEALIGAIYLDQGYNSCSVFIQNKLLKERVNLKSLEKKIASHKGALLEWGQKHKQTVKFEVTKVSGESHARQYEISILLNDQIVSTGVGSSKKKAEEEAARKAYNNLPATL